MDQLNFLRSATYISDIVTPLIQNHINKSHMSMREYKFNTKLSIKLKCIMNKIASQNPNMK